MPAIRWSPAIWWSIGSMDFDNQKVYGDTSITDGLVWFTRIDNVQYPFLRLQTSPLVSASNVVTLLLKCRSLPSLSTTAAWSCDSEWSWNWDVQGVNFATLVVRTLATVVQKEADMYLPTNLVPLHIIKFEPAGVNKKQYFNWLSWVWAIFKTVYQGGSGELKNVFRPTVLISGKLKTVYQQ